MLLVASRLTVRQFEKRRPRRPPDFLLRSFRRGEHYHFMNWQHLSDHDLEQYYLGMINDETELAALEEHFLACGPCAERADETQDYVGAMRVAALMLPEFRRRVRKRR